MMVRYQRTNQRATRLGSQPVTVDESQEDDETERMYDNINFRPTLVNQSNESIVDTIKRVVLHEYHSSGHGQRQPAVRSGMA